MTSTVTADCSRPVQACFHTKNGPRAGIPLAHLHSGWTVFAQRLLRQSRVKSNLYHAGEDTLARDSCANRTGKTVGGVAQLTLSSSALWRTLQPRLYLELPVAGGIKMTSEAEARETPSTLRYRTYLNSTADIRALSAGLTLTTWNH